LAKSSKGVEGCLQALCVGKEVQHIPADNQIRIRYICALCVHRVRQQK
jgi:hypothetical protein